MPRRMICVRSAIGRVAAAPVGASTTTRSRQAVHQPTLFLHAKAGPGVEQIAVADLGR